VFTTISGSLRHALTCPLRSGNHRRVARLTGLPTIDVHSVEYSTGVDWLAELDEKMAEGDGVDVTERRVT
jgi:hypothetical protein